ncbi:MAG: tungstate ABC transporter substrate-binding protein WtpA [Methanocellales archaeon]|nr:tungstate ABC transporter substrate-binding protein WtpA [Methanocellales archaeon]MDD3421252.1 tungstate ABC transporter substrate-binding protein WtpA [Methanocellales archaeon]MDD4898532.1 tungstate ABC transporter substrate-binding protein WtpA [Methanocellales archaeon]
MKVRYIIALVTIVAVVLIMAMYLPHSQTKETKLKVIYAGSLIVPFEEMERQFEELHPGVDVQIEGHGSIQSIRYVTDVHKECDVVAVADDSLIPDMMYPEYADWYVRFATNQMVITYTNSSKYAEEINESNWYEVLARPDVKFGFSNPMLDACGYRTLMVIQLAELYYENQTIFDDLITCDFDPTIQVIEDDGTYTVVVPEVFEPQGDKISIRGGSVQLLALLDYAGIDYAFEYKSVAQQHDLRYLELPAQIDLSSPEYGDIYAKVKVKLGFQRFTSVGVERIGMPIFYGATIPKNAPNPEMGLEFVKFVLSEEGQNVLRDKHQPIITPTVDDLDKLPPELRNVVTKEIRDTSTENAVNRH